VRLTYPMGILQHSIGIVPHHSFSLRWITKNDVIRSKTANVLGSKKLTISEASCDLEGDLR
jgi:hypothetical protein